MTEWQSQVSLALLVPYVLQYLKKSKWFPLVSYTTDKLNRTISAVIAFVAGFGIAINFDDSAGVLTVTGLTIAGLWTGTLHAVQQFLMQHTVYKLAVAPPPPGVEQAIVRNAEAGYLVSKDESKP